MADDLLAFLRARLEEDEQAALAAKPGPWHADGGSVYATHWIDEVVDYSESAEHIARHDPARVLADVAAKRQVVDRYERAMANRRAHPDDLATAGALLALHGVVQLLVLPFRDHPDFDAAWAVDTPQ